MAGPFNIDISSPAASDVISAYPLNERQNRITINNWLTFMSNPANGIIKAAALPTSVPDVGEDNIWTAQNTFQSTNPILTFIKTNTTVPNAEADVGLFGVSGSYQIRVDADSNQPSARFEVWMAGSAIFTIAHNGALGLGQPLAVDQGGTGATTDSAARTNLGLGTAAVENIGTSGAKIPLLNVANTWSADQTFNTGIDFIGSATSNNDITHHINLFGGTYGFNAFGGQVNYRSAGAHSFRVGTTEVASISATGAIQMDDPATTRTNLQLGGLAILNDTDLVYTGTNGANTSYPIGSTIYMIGNITRNAANNVYIGGGGDPGKYFSTNQGAGQLSGTWHARGSDGTNTLMQRTA